MSNQMSNQTSQTKNIEKFASHPITSILLTTLASVIPPISITKDLIDKSVSKIQQDRFEAMLDELANGKLELTEELISTEEFIHSFVIVYRAVINTYSREKIRYFARLLKSGVQKEETATDRFEDFVNILETMSILELAILKLLHEYELKYYNDSHSESDKYKILGEFWNDFLQTIQEQHNISKENLEAKLARLNRTGFYKNFTGMYWGYKGDKGLTTVLYKEFVEWIELENESE